MSESNESTIQHFVDRGPEIVASSLAAQLGSDLKDVAQGKNDMRRLSVIDEKDKLFLMYAKIRSRKSKAWKALYEEFLNLNVSIGGRGRRDIIRMEAVSKGGMAGVESEIPQRPNWIGRNITQRNWKQEQEMNRF